MLYVEFMKNFLLADSGDQMAVRLADSSEHMAVGLISAIWAKKRLIPIF